MIGFVDPSDRARDVWAAMVTYVREKAAGDWAIVAFAQDRPGYPPPPAPALTPSIVADQLRGHLLQLARVAGVDYELDGWRFEVKLAHNVVNIGALSPDGVPHGLLSLAGYDDIQAVQVS